MSESQLFIASSVGFGLLLAGWIWIVFVAWRSRLAWGMAVLLFPPAGLLFAIRRSSRARRPLMVGLLGLLLIAGPPVVNRLLPLDLGPRDTLVEGERHLTLTGWDRRDYGVIESRPDVVVLQMANADVTDETLRLLADLERLRELDLSNTSVTDAGLGLVGGLAGLERLRLANTRVTDAGFREHLMDHPGLSEIDLRGTAVAHETISDWRAAKSGRRALR
jgi:hypothetical protein